jgi:uncharacterized protein
MPSLIPVPRAERSGGIDIARGLALLGIIVVNARFFFLPSASAAEIGPPPEGLQRSSLDWAVHDVVDVLANYKFISVFSLLFGFGLAQQAARCAAAGRSRWRMGLRRLGLLLAIGLLHGLLVWYGDVLTIYAIIGTVVLACIGLDDRWLHRVTMGVVALVLLVTVASAGMEWGFFGAAADDGSVAVVAEHPLRGVDAMTAADFDISSRTWIEAEAFASRQGPWLDATAFRAVSYALSLLIAPISYGWQVLLMMLVGVWAQRTRLFAPESSSRRRVLAVRLIAAGLPFAAAAVLPGWFLGRESPAAIALFTLALQMSAFLLPVGYACLAVEFGPRLPTLLRAPIQAAGSIGLTVYLCESLVCTGIASWWGLARFGTMTDVEFTAIVIGVWAGLIVAALAWTRVFGSGPMERFWRWSTYG